MKDAQRLIGQVQGLLENSSDAVSLKTAVLRLAGALEDTLKEIASLHQEIDELNAQWEKTEEGKQTFEDTLTEMQGEFSKKAAELVNILQPEVAIPVHYGSIVGKISDAAVFAGSVKAPVKVEIRIR